MSLFYALAVFVGIFLVGMFYWRQAVVGALVLAVFEGALRKWFFPEAHQWVYLAKDVLLLGAYVRFFAGRRAGTGRPIPAHPTTVPLIGLGALTFVQLMNPNLPNFWVGLFGIRAYLIYVPLLYIVPAVFRDAESLRKFWTQYLLLAAVPLMLGPLQFAAPVDSILNRYAWQDEAPSIAALFGNRPRITSTFSYMSGYTTYLQVLFLVGLSTLLFDPKAPIRWYRWALLGGIIANLWMTGARGAFILLGAAVLILLMLTVKLHKGRALRPVVLLCVGLPVLALIAETVFPEAYWAFVERARQSEDIPGRITGIVTHPIWALGEAGLFGYGVGSTHQAIAVLAPGASAAPPAEGELERIVLELGPLGLILILWARLMVTVRSWRAVKAARGTGLQPYLVAAFLYGLMSLPGPLVFNHTAHLFYWFMAGLALIPARGAK